MLWFRLKKVSDFGNDSAERKNLLEMKEYKKTWLSLALFEQDITNFKTRSEKFKETVKRLSKQAWDLQTAVKLELLNRDLFSEKKSS